MPDYYIKLPLPTNPPQCGVAELITGIHDVRYCSPLTLCMVHHLDLVIFIVVLSKWSLSCFLSLTVFTRLRYVLVAWISVVFDTLFKAI